MATLKNLLFVFFCTVILCPLTANHCDSVLVKGGGIYINPSVTGPTFNLRNTQFYIKTHHGKIVKGRIINESKSVVPFDPVNGFEVDLVNTVDAVRVFADHPDIVWVHGISRGVVRYGTSPSFGAFAGTTLILNESNGEYIGGIARWGRTGLLTEETAGAPLPNFETATEEELMTFVDGFAYSLLQPPGSKPGVVKLKTSGGNFIITK